MIQVESINQTSPTEARRLFFNCCGCDTWARAMAQGRPYASPTALFKAADVVFEMLSREDWLEAFSHHPKIGDIESLRRKFRDTAHLAGAEQAGVNNANEQTIAALTAGNSAYEEKFGFIFIVSASGKTAEEMLALLRQRLANSFEDELKIASAEQKKITKFRMEKIAPS